MSLPLHAWWTHQDPGTLNQPMPPPPPLGHAGLWLDRCLSPIGSEESGKPNRSLLYRSAIAALRPGGSAAAAWAARSDAVLNTLSQPGPNRAVTTLDVQTTGRMLLHPGANSTVTDGTVLLHHTWGVPYLPGSGLKGLARAQARLCGMNDVDEVRLFGNEPGAPADSAGYVNFLDGFWLPVAPPNMPRWSPLELDVVTPHHSAYYTEGKPAGDWEEPVPTQRLVISEGTRFRIILEGALAPAEDLQPWLDLAKELVVGGLTGLGFSAWTRAGYGQMVELDQGGRPPPASSSAPAAGHTAKPSADREWLPATLRRDPGKGSLKATLADRREAEVGHPHAVSMFGRLPPEIQQQLKARKPVEVRVRIEAVGLRWVIVEIESG